MKPRPVVVLPSGTSDLPLTDVKEVAVALADTFNKVRRGEIDLRVGHCLAALAGQMLRAFQVDTERQIAVSVKPAPPTSPLLTPEQVQRLLNQVRARHDLSPPALPVVPTELPAPAPNGVPIGGSASCA
jgi:hypothetical protein